MTTQNTIKTSLASLLGAASLLAPSAAKAEDAMVPDVKAVEKPLINGVYADVGLYSKYLGTFGFTLSEGNVIQSDIGFNIGKIGYNLWNNVDQATGKMNELDNTISYTQSAGKHLDITAKALYFTFPNTQLDDAYTFDLTFATKDLPVDAKLYLNQTLGKGSHYGRLGQVILGKTFKMNDNVSLTLEGRATYNDHYFTTESGISTLRAAGQLDVKLGKGYTLSASIAAQKAIKEMGGAFIDNKGVLGINLHKDF